MTTNNNDDITSPNAIDNATHIQADKMNLLNDVTVQLTIEVGRAKLTIRDLLALKKDSILELDKASGDPVDIYVNGRLIAKGNIINANGKYCVRLINVMNDADGANAING